MRGVAWVGEHAPVAGAAQTWCTGGGGLDFMGKLGGKVAMAII